jgi:carbohydrate-binding DOMON domain-containing protein
MESGCAASLNCGCYEVESNSFWCRGGENGDWYETLCGWTTTTTTTTSTTTTTPDPNTTTTTTTTTEVIRQAGKTRHPFVAIWVSAMVPLSLGLILLIVKTVK